MTVNELYDSAEENDVPILEYDLTPFDSMALQDDDFRCCVGLNSKKKFTQAELKVILAHELGHCKTGSFYNRYSKFDLVCQHEYRANRQAVLDLVPYEDLMEALQDGITEVWELAEHFDVTEDFIRTVFKHYEAMGKNFND